MDFKRPYCNKCKAIYGKSALHNRLLKCQKCRNDLVIKNFNPYTKALIGLGVILLGIGTLFIQGIPIVWIGGFLWGGTLIINGIQTYITLEELEGRKILNKGFPGDKFIEDISGKILDFVENRKNRKKIIIKCDFCGVNLRFPKTKKVLIITCPNCKNSFEYNTMETFNTSSPYFYKTSQN